jgi:hypothetical protein
MRARAWRSKRCTNAKQCEPPSCTVDFPGDHLEPTFTAAGCIARADVPSVQAHRDQRLRRRNVVGRPFFGSRLGIRVGEQILFTAAADAVHVATNAGGIDLTLRRQHLLEQLVRLKELPGPVEIAAGDLSTQKTEGYFDARCLGWT